MLKEDILAFMEEFHQRGKISKGMGASFIALVPKKEGEIGIKDYKPISLLGSIYKILAKVLAGRIQKILPSIISNEQGTFVKGRQILDDILVANECMHSRYKDRLPGLICKLDLEKAYDRVNRKFLLYMLKRMGFGETWRKWIQECVSLAWISIMINGSPKGFFPAEKGLRQGDPLCPFLFLIVAEDMGGAVNAGLFEGFQVAKNTSAINHLQHADDSLIFCGVNEDHVRNVKATLLCFEEVYWALKSTSSKVS